LKEASRLHASYESASHRDRAATVRLAFMAYVRASRAGVVLSDTELPGVFDPDPDPPSLSDLPRAAPSPGPLGMRVWSRSAPVDLTTRSLALLAVAGHHAVATAVAKWRKAAPSALVRLAGQLAACYLADLFGVPRDVACANLPESLWPAATQWREARWGDNAALCGMLAQTACRAALAVVAAYYERILYPREDALDEAAQGSLPPELHLQITLHTHDYPVYVPAPVVGEASSSRDARRNMMRSFAAQLGLAVACGASTSGDTNDQMDRDVGQGGDVQDDLAHGPDEDGSDGKYTA
jgi:hypothetical protein